MSALILGLDVTLVSGLRVYRMRLAYDETILNQLSDILSAVGSTNFSRFIGVEPDLLLSAFQHGRREAT